MDEASSGCQTQTSQKSLLLAFRRHMKWVWNVEFCSGLAIASHSVWHSRRDKDFSVTALELGLTNWKCNIQRKERVQPRHATPCGPYKPSKARLASQPDPAVSANEQIERERGVRYSELTELPICMEKKRTDEAWRAAAAGSAAVGNESNDAMKMEIKCLMWSGLKKDGTGYHHMKIVVF